jgi:4-amino-4-deoxy-L-arabinose transferase-like glycosyltransferase
MPDDAMSPAPGPLPTCAGPAWPARTGPALACLLVVWALLYLPGLGSLELQGEEARRIFPGMAMIETGDWIAPRVGGEFYLKKPPLANWLIAGSLLATGSLSEWAARLPSALSVLVAVCGLFFCLRRVLAPAGAFLAAAFLLTNIGLLEKGRLAEIDALYLMAFGLGWAWWAAQVSRGESPSWRAWLPAGVLLGLGMMTKGPLPLLLFFYAFVVAELWAAGRLRSLLSWSHLAGLLAVLLPFVVWSLAQSAQVGAEQMAGVWTSELVTRATPERFSVLRWVENVVRGVTNFLPWAALLPLLWWKPLVARLPEADRRRFVAARWALTGAYLAVALLPGSRPRYTMPLLVPASVLLALVLCAGAPEGILLAWRRTVRVVALLCALAAVTAPWVLARSFVGWAVALVVATGAFFVWRWGGRLRRAESLTLATLALAVMCAQLFFMLGLPVLVERGQ